jgi:hypothetical protein
MDFSKFVYMLDSHSLFFCRPDCLDDRFEGTWGKASRRTIELELRQRIDEGKNVIGGVEHQLSGHKRVSDHVRQLTAVNCWHLNPHESAAMWRLYIYAQQGIAIRSTTARLIRSFSDDKGLLVHVGLVQYIDFDADAIPSGNYLTPFLYKRKSFEHERELRAIAVKAEIIETEHEGSIRTLDQPFAEPGEDVAVDLSALLEAVYLAPGSPAWMERLVASVAERFAVKVPVVRSRLDDGPV